MYIPGVMHMDTVANVKVGSPKRRVWQEVIAKYKKPFPASAAQVINSTLLTQ